MKFNDSYIPGLAHSPEVVALLVDAGEQVAGIVRSTAPVSSGEYVSMVRVEVGRTAYRSYARVVAGSDHSLIVEAKHGTLARALGQVASRG